MKTSRNVDGFIVHLAADDGQLLSGACFSMAGLPESPDAEFVRRHVTVRGRIRAKLRAKSDVPRKRPRTQTRRDSTCIVV